MKETDQILETVGSSMEYGKKYLENQRDLLKLEVAERSAKLISGMATSLVVGLSFLLVWIFASITLALWLSDLVGSPWSGFGIVSLMHLLLGVILYVFRKPLITNPLLSSIIKMMFQ